MKHAAVYFYRRPREVLGNTCTIELHMYLCKIVFKNSHKKAYVGVFPILYQVAHGRGGLISIKNGGSLGLPSVSSASEREAPLFDATLSMCVCVCARAHHSTPLSMRRKHHLAIRGAFSTRFSSARFSPPPPPPPTRRNCVACAASAYFECPVREYQKLLIHSMLLRVCATYTRAQVVIVCALASQ